MYLLDTDVVSELRRGDRADSSVRAWAERPPAGLFLTEISLLELEIGVLRIERRDTAQGTLLRQWFEEQVIARFRKRILGVDAAVASACARLHVPDPRPDRDALIAGSALVHGLIVVPRSEVDFAWMGVRVLNSWPASAT